MTLRSPQPVQIVDSLPAGEAELRNQVLSNLLRVSTYLVSVLDPETLIQSLVQRVVEVVPAVQAGLLWLFDHQQASLHVASVHGLDLGTAQDALMRLRLRPGEGLAGVVLQRGEPLLIEGRSAYREMAGRISARSQNDIHQYFSHLPRTMTVVVLPLRIGTEIIGVLELLNLGTRPSLHHPDLQALQMFANLAAGAIKNAQLHTQMQTHQRRLEAFGSIGTVVSAAADLDELINNVLDVVLGLVGATTGALLLLDPSRAVLSLGSQRGLTLEITERLAEFPVSEAPCEEAVRYGQPIHRPLLPETEEDLLIAEGFGSCAYIPLLAGGTVVGLISIYGDAPLIDRSDIQALMMISSLVGFAIANVRLYRDSQIERRKLTAVINSIVEGVALCDARGRLVLANQTAMSLLSIAYIPYEQPLSEMPDFYAIRDLEGQPLPVEQLPFARALSGVVFHDYRVLQRGASGADTVMSFSGAPVYNDDQRIEGAVVIFRDITASQKLERAKDDFLAVAAHELRSPLAAVRGYADLLVRREQRRSEETSPELRGLTSLSQQVTHMLRLVDNLLDASRLDAGQFNLQLQSINLVSLAEQVIEQQRLSAGDRELLLESDQSELTIVCDPLRIRQVVTNLVGNAIHYSPAATRIYVKVSAEHAGLLIARHPACMHALAASQRNFPDDEILAIVAVEDQGIGISDEQFARLFQRYARGNTRRGDGLGLGLYLSREFVTRHGGMIWAESVPEQGSTFYIALPLHDMSASNHGAEGEELDAKMPRLQ